MLLGLICFHVITYDFIEADGQWEKFVLQYHSEKRVLAALKCIDSAHSADNLSRIYYIF
jgi:succinate dehydrogenase/fumarate reductase-like Fe-S protein